MNCNKSGGGLYRNAFREKVYKEIKNAAVKKIKTHNLRHTHATILLKQGVNPKIISERLGYTDISLTLKIYSHVLPSMQEEGVKNFGENIFG
ncbi:tyrosine-type recombinase/integrase [Bacillus cereus]|uniref:Tyrosine-type recombinase/integrase n=1 Tax=Bacillus cereus TaxID=1396 RepID=A0AAW7NG02_BACCE|nr:MULTISPECIES: tyrosine-type recombinase/integrase [Bacillus]MCU5743786.1 tyrosine-type recombinase/integrase [Bacillus cereus]MCU9578720.1 tyrosine-type recombinase/integrase [Bacillus cereus]MDA1781906.1 tyrosine-type recombinase/integrase [Bacillus cereus]MDA2116388.1 tyrosine-type recombinase/integrase [Bacillus cereus]MDA2132308.1 tyrosine-type recombinase/integrase [Bacillus cereus]